MLAARSPAACSTACWTSALGTSTLRRTLFSGSSSTWVCTQPIQSKHPSPPAGPPVTTTAPPPPTTAPQTTAPPPPPPPPPPARPMSWRSAGAFVWHETDVDPTLLGREMRGNGFGWVAIRIHDGPSPDPVDPS